MDLSKVLEKTLARNGQLEELIKRADAHPALGIATDDRPYDLDLGPGDGSVLTRGRKPNNQGTEAEQPGDGRGRKLSDQGTEACRPGDTRGRKLSDQGTEAEQPGDGSSATRGRKEKWDDASCRTRGRKRTIVGVPGDGSTPTRGRKDPDQGTEALVDQATRGRNDTDQGTEALVDQATRGRKEADQGTEGSRPGDGREAVKGGTLRPQKDALPRISAQRDILLFLRQSLQVETGTTPYLSVKQIAISCHCTLENVKKSLQRLKRKQMVTTITRSFSCTQGGAVYSVPKNVVRWVDELLENEPTRGRKGVSDQGTEANVCSGSLNTTTKPQMSMPSTIGQLQVLVTRLRLDVDFRISANDLVAAQRSNGLPDEEHKASIEHLAFYLRSAEAKGLTQLKGFFMSQLRAGYYAPPVDFVSWEERQLDAKISAQREKARRLAELQKQSFEVNFDVWFAELSQERRAELVRGTPFANMQGPALKACLRETFSKETGQALPESQAE